MTVTDAQRLSRINAHVAAALFHARLPQGRYGVKVDDGHHVTVVDGVTLAPGAPASVDVDLAS